MKNLVFAVCLAGMSLLIVFGLFEGFVRITQSDVKNFDIEMWRYARDLKRVSDIPGMGHEHVPNTSGVYMSVPVSINSAGWRDKEYPLEKPPETVRIMMLGDSVTFGWGALPEGVTSYVLESLLNQAEGPKRYEVMNTGIGNTNTAMQTAYFLHEGYRYKPDIVVLNYFINDAEPTPSRRQSFLVEHSYAAVFLAGRVDVFMRSYFERGDWQAYYKNLYETGQPGWKHAQQALQQLVNYCNAHTIKLMIVNYPELHQLTSYPFQGVTDLIAEQAMKYNVPFLDLLPAVANEEPTSLWVSSTDAHPNGKAGKLFAARLKRALSSTFPDHVQ